MIMAQIIIPLPDYVRLADHPPRTSLRAFGESAIHVRCMKRLTEDDVREIQQIHSRWIEFEVAGEDRRLLALCADNIEFGRPTPRQYLDARRFRRNWRAGTQEFTALRLAVVVS